MEIIWKYIPGTNHRYEVSSDGRVRSRRGILASNSKSGQRTVSFIFEGRTQVFEIRHLMAYAFLGADIHDPVKPIIRHKDGDFTNINLSNLYIDSSDSFQDEEWRPVPEFEGTYEISSLGRVKRIAYEEQYIRADTGAHCVRRHRDKILKVALSPDGYSQINLHHQHKNRYYTIHRLVAQVFIPNPDNKPQVNHIDGVRNNNRVSNLEWCTSSENVQDSIRRSGRSNLTSVIRAVQGRSVMCIETGCVFESIGQAASELGCDNAAISSSIERKSCCFGWTFIYTDNLKDIDLVTYQSEARSKYFSGPRAHIREVDGWKNTFSAAH